MKEYGGQRNLTTVNNGWSKHLWNKGKGTEKGKDKGHDKGSDKGKGSGKY